MAKSTVKSFLIADLLMGSSQHEEEVREKKQEESNSSLKENHVLGQGAREVGKNPGHFSSGKAISPTENVGSIKSTSSSSTTSNDSPLSTSDEERNEKSVKFYDHGSIVSKYETAGTMFQHQGLGPMVYPMANMAGHPATNGLVDTDSNTKGFQAALPYGYDPFRASRLMYGRHHGAMNTMGIPSLPNLTHGAPLPPGLEYSVYSHYPGLYGMPFPTNPVPGLYNKGPLLSDRDNFPMFLGRSMYAANCKRKGGQIRFTNSQTAQLEKAFVQQKYLNANDRKKLAHSLGLSDRQVKTWFQNRRAKLRKCKGGFCAESELSGSPQNSCVMTNQEDSSHNDNIPDGKKSTSGGNTD